MDLTPRIKRYINNYPELMILEQLVGLAKQTDSPMLPMYRGMLLNHLKTIE